MPFTSGTTLSSFASLPSSIRTIVSESILYISSNFVTLFFNVFISCNTLVDFSVSCHKSLSFVFSSSSISESDLSKFHYESLYNDIRINNYNCKAQTFIGSLMVLPEEREPEQEQEQEEDGKI